MTQGETASGGGSYQADAGFALKSHPRTSTFQLTGAATECRASTVLRGFSGEQANLRLGIFPEQFIFTRCTQCMQLQPMF